MSFKIWTSLAVCAVMSACAPHWEYEGEAGPTHWGKLHPTFAVCETGTAQSPIDVKPTETAALPALRFNYLPFAPKVVNNGHTVQVEAPPGSTMAIGGDVYELLQFHFHTPSEYHTNGKSYPLEAHFVHRRGDGTLGVVGVMFEQGEANAELEKLWRRVPTAAVAQTIPAGIVLNIGELLPEKRNYYHFTGSLTTPPCSEGVQWVVMTQPITASAEQIETFRAWFPMNARPLQPTNNRAIVQSMP